jgi:hypothetical protein
MHCSLCAVACGQLVPAVFVSTKPCQTEAFADTGRAGTSTIMLQRCVQDVCAGFTGGYKPSRILSSLETKAGPGTSTPMAGCIAACAQLVPAVFVSGDCVSSKALSSPDTGRAWDHHTSSEMHCGMQVPAVFVFGCIAALCAVGAGCVCVDKALPNRGLARHRQGCVVMLHCRNVLCVFGGWFWFRDQRREVGGC